MWIVARFSPFEWNAISATKYHRVARRVRELYEDNCVCEDVDITHGLCCEVEELLEQQHHHQMIGTGHVFSQFRYSTCTGCSDENCGRNYFNNDAYQSHLYVHQFQVEVTATDEDSNCEPPPPPSPLPPDNDATSTTVVAVEAVDNSFLMRCEDLPAIDSQTTDSVASESPANMNFNDVDFERPMQQQDQYKQQQQQQQQEQYSDEDDMKSLPPPPPEDLLLETRHYVSSGSAVVDNQSINFDLTTDDFAANEDEIELTLFHNDFTLINSFWYTIGTLMAGSDLNPKVFMHVFDLASMCANVPILLGMYLR